MIEQKFGKLTVVAVWGTGPRGTSWRCICECGKKNIKASEYALKNGDRVSCGCTYVKSDKRQPVPRGLRKKHLLTFSSWQGMLARCHYRNNNKSKCYEGVEICDEWLSFERFLRDMGDRPSIEHSLDRQKAELGYSKDNCRWLLKIENSGRTRLNLSPERNKAVSEGLKRAHAEGRIVITQEVRDKISKGGLKRTGRKLQTCQLCGLPSYLPNCQKCRDKAESEKKHQRILERLAS